MRGEKDLQVPVLALTQGSPPHARGKAFKVRPFIAGLGITPACAGKSDFHYSSSGSSRDHPRMRGEKFEEDIVFLLSQGSPPHARGKDVLGFAPVSD